jgi:CheY-like chemotaxis protein
MKNTILILDDEPMFLDWIEDYVESKGFKVKFVVSVDEAFEEVTKKRNYRAIVIDLQVPTSQKHEALIKKYDRVFHEFRGLYIAQRARDYTYKGKQIVVYSVHDRPEVAEVCDKLEISYIPKGRAKLMKEKLNQFMRLMPEE